MMYKENKMGYTLLQEILIERMASEGEGRMEGNVGRPLMYKDKNDPSEQMHRHVLCGSFTPFQMDV